MWKWEGFRLYDRNAETSFSRRDLPHLFQVGALTFVTARLIDSVPKPVRQVWESDQRVWLRSQGYEIRDDERIPEKHYLPLGIQERFSEYRDYRWQMALDEGHGACLLRDPEIAELVISAFRYFDGERYDLHSAIVMPNHFHLLVQFRAMITCVEQCKSWLRFTAREINRRLNRRGHVWQSEAFDHLVRSEGQFHYLDHYIANNGIQAGLPPTDYLYWRCKHA